MKPEEQGETPPEDELKKALIDEAEYIRAFGVAHCIECGDELPEHGVFDDPEKMICSPCWKRIQNPPESESTP